VLSIQQKGNAERVKNQARQVHRQSLTRIQTRALFGKFKTGLLISRSAQICAMPPWRCKYAVKIAGD
jgi:hypothetical protein